MTTHSLRTPCVDCQKGYFDLLDRFERLAAREDGPSFLRRCRVCGALWNETLRFAEPITPSEALRLFPGVRL